MGYFEYKVVPAPTQRRRRQRCVDGLDKYASTVADMLTELGLEGWDFVGAEVLRERRRRFLMLPDEVERTFLVFRRPGSLHRASTGDVAQPAPPPEPVAPRRVRRPDLVAEVAAGARRIEVRTEMADRVDQPAAPDEAPRERHAAEKREPDAIAAE
jgi:hypothetical protein